MLRLIAALLAIFIAVPALAAAFLAAPAAPLVYTGPCDTLGGCDEAYNVDQAAQASYHGPLFQLVLVANPTGSTLDVGQTAQRTADMTTWSAFCGGVQTNCMYSIIYSQINATVNDLSYAVGGCGTFCGCKFQINATTGLPEVPLVAPCEYYILVGGGSEVPATGITGGSGSDITVIATGRNIQTPAQCCNFFGANHKYNAPDTPGTDFGLQVQYSNTGAFLNCATVATACPGLDLEINTIQGADLSSSPIDMLLIGTWAHVANLTTGVVNGHSSWSQTPPVALAPGNYVHVGGGGDLTQPAPFVFRGGYILNSVPTAPQQAALLANVEAFYPGLSFP